MAQTDDLRSVESMGYLLTRCSTSEEREKLQEACLLAATYVRKHAVDEEDALNILDVLGLAS